MNTSVPDASRRDDTCCFSVLGGFGVFVVVLSCFGNYGLPEVVCLRSKVVWFGVSEVMDSNVTNFKIRESGGGRICQINYDPKTRIVATRPTRKAILFVTTSEHADKVEFRRPEVDWFKAQILNLSALLRYLAFGRQLKEMHVTWAHLEKKQKRLRDLTNISQVILLGFRKQFYVCIVVDCLGKLDCVEGYHPGIHNTLGGSYYPVSLANSFHRKDAILPTMFILMFQTSGETLSDHRINEKIIKGLVDNNRFNDSLSGARVGKKKGKTYNVLPKGPVYEAILKKKITKKEDIRENFEIPCSIGGFKNLNTLVDQGSDVNVMPYSTYMKLIDERPAETNIRLSLASHSYIYPLGIAEDVLVEIAEHVYPVDFVILDIKEDEKRPFIKGTPFLTTAKAVIKFDKGTITLRSGKSRKAYLLEDKQIPSVGVFDEGKVKDLEAKGHTDTVDELEMEELTIFIKGAIRDATMPLHAYEVDVTISFKSKNLEEAAVLDATSVDPQELCTERVASGKGAFGLFAILADLWLGETWTRQVLVLFHPLGDQFLNL
ncbi:zinc finger, CCHC-type containing protein [Tanacetum coccineum]